MNITQHPLNEYGLVQWIRMGNSMRLIFVTLAYTPVLKDAKYIKVKSKAKIRNRYNQVPHLIGETIRESDKSTRKHSPQESLEVSPPPTGDHKAAKSITKTIMKHK